MMARKRREQLALPMAERMRHLKWKAVYFKVDSMMLRYT
uniref:Uncharacterized protein n=1 Tax=Picea sitchensis TaxID=3332 RepID=A0A6B9XXE8_PICSI|nr:hypothetical protein Q903MT_gene6767 [Picea sitchensis]